MSANFNCNVADMNVMAATQALLQSRADLALPIDPMFSRKTPREIVANPTIMIVDDEPINVKITRKFLSVEGYREFVTTSDPREAFQLAVDRQPDVILLDIMMPEISGLDILRQIRAEPTTADLPVIILTASNDKETRFQALTFGATDFLYKPLDPLELMPRVRNSLVVKAHRDKMRNYAWEMELEVQARTTEQHAIQQELLVCLATSAAYRDRPTQACHSNVARCAGIIARGMQLSAEHVAHIEEGAPLRNLGKTAFPDSLFSQPEVVAAEEYPLLRKHADAFQPLHASQATTAELIRSHTKIGAEILKAGRSQLLETAHCIALTHHERWDGKGYPNGLSGEEIPLAGRIVAVADVFDTLYASGPIGPGLPLEKCLGIVLQESGLHFDPKVVDAFVAARGNIVKLYQGDCAAT